MNVFPVTPDCWPDLATLFAASQVMRGCWCMWPRTPREEMRVGPENEGRLRAIVDAGRVPGLLAYAGGEPAGWCSVGPLSDYRRFFDGPMGGGTWLIACLFIAAPARGRHVGSVLLEAAVRYAAEHGARRVEGLPRGWRPDDDPATTAAVPRMFRRAGFMDGDAGAVGRVYRDVER